MARGGILGFIAVILIVLFILISFGLIDFDWKEKSMERSKEIRTVKRVIDGDTLELENGQKIRILGIDYIDLDNMKWVQMGISRSRLEKCYYEGISELKKKIEGKDVLLMKDFLEKDKDKYGRLLRYVFLYDEDVGKEMITKGYAIKYDPTFPPCLYCAEYEKIEEAIRKSKVGCLWENGM